MLSFVPLYQVHTLHISEYLVLKFGYLWIVAQCLVITTEINILDLLRKFMAIKISIVHLKNIS